MFPYKWKGPHGYKVNHQKATTSLISRPFPSFLMFHAEKWEGPVYVVTYEAGYVEQ